MSRYSLLPLSALLILLSCNEQKDAGRVNSKYAAETANVDDSRIVYKDRAVVIKSKSDSIDMSTVDVYVKFAPFITFDDFKVNSIYTAEKAKLQLAKGDDYWLFRTTITNGYKGPVSFAGKYCFVVWGCGSGCQAAAIIDATNGKIYPAPQAVQGYSYRVDSRLLFVNPPQDKFQFSGTIDSTAFADWTSCGYCTPKVFIWNEEEKDFIERVAAFN